MPSNKALSGLCLALTAFTSSSQELRAACVSRPPVSSIVDVVQPRALYWAAVLGSLLSGRFIGVIFGETGGPDPAV